MTARHPWHWLMLTVAASSLLAACALALVPAHAQAAGTTPVVDVAPLAGVLAPSPAHAVHPTHWPFRTQLIVLAVVGGAIAVVYIAFGPP